MMAAQVSLVPGLGHGSGVPWHSSTFHLQPTEAQAELSMKAPHAVGVPVQTPPEVPPPVVALATPPEPTGVVTPPIPPAPPVSWLPVPPSPPPSGSAGAHTHAVNVPAALHVWAPCCPVGHAQSTLAPGTHLGASPPPPQAPSNAKGMNEARILGTLPMAGSSLLFGFSATPIPCKRILYLGIESVSRRSWRGTYSSSSCLCRRT